jgi:hypothetical protein
LAHLQSSPPPPLFCFLIEFKLSRNLDLVILVRLID